MVLCLFATVGEESDLKCAPYAMLGPRVKSARDLFLVQDELFAAEWCSAEIN